MIVLYMTKLNNNGDKLIKTTEENGSDISSQRIDELDQKSLFHAVNISRKDNSSAVDLGSGLGSQGIRFANLGINTTLIDKLNIKTTIENIKQVNPHINQEIKYINKNIKNLTEHDLSQNLDIIYSQRFIHYLTYEKAEEILSLLFNHMSKDGKMYLSASGLNSELSKGYVDKNKNIKNRYGKLSNKMANKHNIKSPVCLYSKKELKTLLEKIGFTVDEIYTSEFGNIKSVSSI